MPVNFIQEKKKQKYLIIFFVIIILVSIFILRFGYFQKEKSVSSPVSIKVYHKEVKINFAVFKNPLLKELQIFEKIGSFEGKKGRKNPFLPY